MTILHLINRLYSVFDEHGDLEVNHRLYDCIGETTSFLDETNLKVEQDKLFIETDYTGRCPDGMF